MPHDQNTVDFVRQIADDRHKIAGVAAVKFAVFNSVTLRKFKLYSHDFGSLSGAHGVTVEDQFRVKFHLTHGFALNCGVGEPNRT